MFGMLYCTEDLLFFILDEGKRIMKLKMRDNLNVDHENGIQNVMVDKKIVGAMKVEEIGEVNASTVMLEIPDLPLVDPKTFTLDVFSTSVVTVDLIDDSDYRDNTSDVSFTLNYDYFLEDSGIDIDSVSEYEYDISDPAVSFVPVKAGMSDEDVSELERYRALGSIDAFESLGSSVDIKQCLDILVEFMELGAASSITDLRSLGVLMNDGFLDKISSLMAEHGKNIDVKLMLFKYLMEENRQAKSSTKRQLESILEGSELEDSIRENLKSVLKELS